MLCNKIVKEVNNNSENRKSIETKQTLKDDKSNRDPLILYIL